MRCCFVQYKNEISTISRGNKLSLWTDLEGNPFSKSEINDSWKISYTEKVSRNEDENGLRMPQFGALSAIRAHWTISNSPATIVLPTGTGKTETMYATIISELISKTLIIVPTDLLREQIFKGAKQFGILPKAGLISDKVIFPTTLLYKSKVNKDHENSIIEAFERANIIVSTPKMIRNLPTKILNKLINDVEVVIFDEAHHLAAPQWSAVKDMFIEKKNITIYRNTF